MDDLITPCIWRKYGNRMACTEAHTWLKYFWELGRHRESTDETKTETVLSQSIVINPWFCCAPRRAATLARDKTRLYSTPLNKAKIYGAAARKKLSGIFLVLVRIFCSLGIKIDFINGITKFSDVLEASIDGSKPYVGNLVESLQFAHDQLADLTR